MSRHVQHSVPLIRALLLVALFFLCQSLSAQDTLRTARPTLERAAAPVVPLSAPTTRPTFSGLQPTVNGQQPTAHGQQPATVVKGHSPQRALLLSLLPGAGQVYNRQAWKVPVVYAALATVGYFVYDNYTQMSAFKNDYLHRIQPGGTPLIDQYASYPNESIYNMYQAYNKNFQLMIIVGAGVYALNLVDAYVFGHLFDFQINDDLSLHLAPSLQPLPTIAPTMSLTLRF